jgi:DNA-binding MarR family transcriptional regulator
MSIEKTRKARLPQPADESLLEDAAHAVGNLAALFRHDVDRATAHSGLSQPMASALGRLFKLPDQSSVGALAHSLGCNMGNLSGTLDRLEEAGCIERIVGEADRRARFIRVTAKGRKIAEQIIGTFRRGRIWTALTLMDAEQLKAMTESIDRLNDAVYDAHPGIERKNSAPRKADLI